MGRVGGALTAGSDEIVLPWLPSRERPGTRPFLMCMAIGAGDDAAEPPTGEPASRSCLQA